MAQKDKNVRLKGVTVEKPIVFGNLAWHLGKKAEEGTTHKWKVFVRGLHNEDISYFVKKVVFTLHPSFAEPKRGTNNFMVTKVVDKHPFEITERGWGEFEIAIRIYFQDLSEKPVDLIHLLRLFPAPDTILPPGSPVLSEFYDEIVFNQPREEFYHMLIDDVPEGDPTGEKAANFSEEEELKKIRDAQSKVKEEIRGLKNRLSQLGVPIGDDEGSDFESGT